MSIYNLYLQIYKIKDIKYQVVNIIIIIKNIHYMNIVYFYKNINILDNIVITYLNLLLYILQINILNIVKKVIQKLYITV